MLAFLVVVGLTAFVALQFGGAPAVSPAPSDLASVDGVIVGVEGEGLGNVRSFDLRLADGTVRVFTLEALENGTTFPPGHLAEHQVSAQPVRVWYRPGTLQATRLEDAPG